MPGYWSKIYALAFTTTTFGVINIKPSLPPISEVVVNSGSEKVNPLVSLTLPKL